MEVTEFGIVTLVRLVQPENEDSDIDETELGMIKSPDKPLQLQNAAFPIDKIELGRLKLVRFLQYQNAFSPIEVTEFGIVTLVKPLH